MKIDVIYDTISLISSCTDISNKSSKENKHKHFVFNNAFPKKRAVYGTLWKKYGKARQATDNNMAHA
jgi:hypothetical protein